MEEEGEGGSTLTLRNQAGSCIFVAIFFHRG